MLTTFDMCLVSLWRCRWRITKVPIAPACDILLCCFRATAWFIVTYYIERKSTNQQVGKCYKADKHFVKKKKSSVLCYLTKLLDNNKLIQKVWQSLNCWFNTSSTITHGKWAEALCSLLLCYNMLCNLIHVFCKVFCLNRATSCWMMKHIIILLELKSHLFLICIF